MLWYRALPTHSQKAVFVKNSLFWPRMYSCGYRSKILADTNWSKTPMTKGGRTVKTTLYNDNVHDSYAICPEKLLKNENCFFVSVMKVYNRENMYPELRHIQYNIFIERI